MSIFCDIAQDLGDVLNVNGLWNDAMNKGRNEKNLWDEDKSGNWRTCFRKSDSKKTRFSASAISPNPAP